MFFPISTKSEGHEYNKNKYINTLKEETFAGRKFHGFVFFFWQIRESLFRKIFQTEASAKVYSRKIRESRVIYDVDSKNDKSTVNFCKSHFCL